MDFLFYLSFFLCFSCWRKIISCKVQQNEKHVLLQLRPRNPNYFAYYQLEFWKEEKYKNWWLFFSKFFFDIWLRKIAFSAFVNDEVLFKATIDELQLQFSRTFNLCRTTQNKIFWANNLKLADSRRSWQQKLFLKKQNLYFNLLRRTRQAKR